MTTELSFVTLFLNASVIVKLVMLMLLLASVFSWTFILQRGFFLQKATSAMEEFEFNFWSGIDLNKLYNKLYHQGHTLRGLDAIFVSGFKEYVRQLKQSNVQPEIILEGIARAMRVSLGQEEEDLERNLPFLATVQSISPYVGLFGTVWGIMHSFSELGTAQQATLAMVAPGISEALIATAMGLVAAIPAGIAYNRYITRADKISNKYRLFVEELVGIMHRRVYSSTIEHQRQLYTGEINVG